MIKQALGLVGLLLAGAASAQLAPTGSTSKSAINIGVNNGVSAWWIGNVNVYAPKAADPKDAELRDMLAEIRDLNLAATKNLLDGEVPSYMFLTDGLGMAPGQSKTWFVLALDADDFDDSFPAVCEVNDDWALGGFSITTGPDGKAVIAFLNARSKPVLEPLCEGLAKPVSSLTGSKPMPDSRSVIDMFAREKPVMAMILMPARQKGVEFEANVGRYFWVPAFVARYMRVPQGADIVERPQNFEAMTEFKNGREGILSAASPPFPTLGRGFDAYPQPAKAEFAGLPRLDSDWIAFLSRAGATVRGRSISLMEQAPLSERLHRFTNAELGAPDFWRSANDAAHVMEFGACIGGRFLIAQGYRPKDLQGSFGRCAMSEIKPPS